MSHNQNNENLVAVNRSFKKAIIEVIFSQGHTFYIHCKPDPALYIGNRGFSQKERKEGVVLVFGPHSVRRLSIDDCFIHCYLRFDRWEKLRIPFECISRIFDKGSQMIMHWAVFSTVKKVRAGLHDARGVKTVHSSRERERERTPAPGSKSKKPASRVIKVDFSHRILK